ncbi:ATP-binding cassette domain-containing protein, partial [Blautia wexlerae]
MNDIILKVDHLSKYFALVKALDDISFDVRRGEVHALCGENGAGKSTFIKLLTGAYEPTKGTIDVGRILRTFKIKKNVEVT